MVAEAGHDGSRWQDVRTGEQIVDALGLTGVGVPAIDRLLLAPDSGRYLRVEPEPPLRPGEFGYAIPGTRYFFNVTACRELKGDAIVALAAFLATRSAPAAAAAAALRKLYDNLTPLSDEEAQIVRAIIRACPGNPYDMPVAAAEVRQAFRGDPERVDDLLDGLQGKGIISGRRGDRIQLTF
jgi:hypothetical protein